MPPPPAPPGPAVLWSCSRPVGPPLPPFFEPHWAEVSVRVVVPRARPGNRYTYVSAHRCACHGMLRAVVLSTAHTLSIQPKSAAHIKLNTVTKVGIGVRAPLPMSVRAGCNPSSQSATIVSRVAVSGLSIVSRAIIARTIAKRSSSASRAMIYSDNGAHLSLRRANRRGNSGAGMTSLRDFSAAETYDWG